MTRSGTNEFHGSTFWTHRNNSAGLRARQRQDGNEAAQLIRNEFGFSAGGPLIKNRTFWFAAYEGSRLRQRSFAGAPVPTADMWNGNLSNLVDGNSIQTTVFDPLTTGANGTRELFPNLQIPTSRISHYGQVMASQTPLPTLNVNPLVGRNFEAFYPLTTDTDQFTVKGDHRFSDTDFLSARFTARAPTACKPAVCTARPRSVATIAAARAGTTPTSTRRWCVGTTCSRPR
ncbi:MAG: hypothetical protein R2724_27715 [Bryobacterales bacterium]